MSFEKCGHFFKVPRGIEDKHTGLSHSILQYKTNQYKRKKQARKEYYVLSLSCIPQQEVIFNDLKYSTVLVWGCSLEPVRKALSYTIDPSLNVIHIFPVNIK